MTATSAQITATLNRAFWKLHTTVAEWARHNHLPYSAEYYSQFLRSRLHRGRPLQFEWTIFHAGTLLHVAYALEIPKETILKLLEMVGDTIYSRILKGEKTCEHSGTSNAAKAEVSTGEQVKPRPARSARSKSLSVKRGSSPGEETAHNLQKVLKVAKRQKSASAKSS